MLVQMPLRCVFLGVSKVEFWSFVKEPEVVCTYVVNKRAVSFGIFRAGASFVLLILEQV
jgi:hypothetical protein